MKCSSERPRISEKEDWRDKRDEVSDVTEERDGNRGWASVRGKWDAIEAREIERERGEGEREGGREKRGEEAKYARQRKRTCARRGDSTEIQRRSP